MAKCKKAVKFVLRLCLLRIFWPALYRLGCLRRVNPRLVLFASESWPEPTDNFRPLIRRLTEEGYDCRFYGNHGEPKLLRYLRSVRFFRDYARARALFIDEAYSPSLACPPRRGTDLVQLWHGGGACKKTGYSTIDLDWGPSRRELKWMPMHRHYTHVCVTAPEIIPFYAEAFRCPPENVRPWGMPRTDVYHDPAFVRKGREEVLAAFPEIGERKIVLYAPTFRGNSVPEARHDAALDIPLLAEELGEDCALLLRPHPKVNVSLGGNAGRAFAFDCRGLRIDTLLCAADLLIADYSSLMCEYALLQRPMLFYAYDLEDYDASRSFYYPYKTYVPGEVVTEPEEIADAVRRNLGGGFDAERVARFRQRFVSACDGKCTERIAERVLGR